jgi:hypothetical protein
MAAKTPKGKARKAKRPRPAARKRRREDAAKGKKKLASRSGRRTMQRATQKLERELRAMKARLEKMMREDGIDPDELAVQSAKDFAEQMAEISRGFKEALKRAAMADGKLVPGQVLNVRGRRVFLKPRPGCPEGSMDPDHYDLTYEMIH